MYKTPLVSHSQNAYFNAKQGQFVIWIASIIVNFALVKCAKKNKPFFLNGVLILLLCSGSSSCRADPRSYKNIIYMKLFI